MATIAYIYVSISGSRTDNTGSIFNNGVAELYSASLFAAASGTLIQTNYQKTDRNSQLIFDISQLYNTYPSADPATLPISDIRILNGNIQTIQRGGGFTDTYQPTDYRLVQSVYLVTSGSVWRYPATGSIVVPVGISMTPTSFTSSKNTFYTVSDNYENTLAIFKNKLLYADNITLPQPEPYNPSRVRYIITRLQELRASTINPALRFTAMASNRTVQLALLNRMNSIITQYSGLYSYVINDGEGIPYQ